MSNIGLEKEIIIYLDNLSAKKCSLKGLHEKFEFVSNAIDSLIKKNVVCIEYIFTNGIRVPKYIVLEKKYWTKENIKPNMKYKQEIFKNKPRDNMFKIR